MKKTIHEKLQKRKYKLPPRSVYTLYNFILRHILNRQYQIDCTIVDDVRKCEGPCFVVFNHLSRIDHAYVMQAAYPRRTNMLASYSEFFRSKFWTVFRWNKVIPKKPYSADTLSIRAMGRIIKHGGCVTIAPEGQASDYGNNKPIVPGTSKLFKHYKVPVYLCMIKGQFLKTNKTSVKIKKGKTEATLSLLFSAEDTKRLSVEEMDDIINEKFRHNEYEWNREHHIKWKNPGTLCDRLEDFCYKCPKCGKEFTMKGAHNRIECSACGNGAEMDDYYEFHPYPDAVIPRDPVEWVEQERVDIIREIREDPNYRFEDEVQIGNLSDHKLVRHNKISFVTGEGKAWVDHSGLHYNGTRHNEPYSFDVPWKQLYKVIMEVDATCFSLYVNGEYFDIIPKHQTVGKFSLLIEEMHRYHVNFYKNFKWNDWMYEGMELGIDAK